MAFQGHVCIGLLAVCVFAACWLGCFGCAWCSAFDSCATRFVSDFAHSISSSLCELIRRMSSALFQRRYGKNRIVATTTIPLAHGVLRKVHALLTSKATLYVSPSTYISII